MLGVRLRAAVSAAARGRSGSSRNLVWSPCSVAIRTARASRPASSRTRVIQQRGGVLLAEELHEGQIEHVLNQPRIIAAFKGGLDLGRRHGESELGVSGHEADPSGENGL